ncbi:MBL fold metallo-hydrolase [Subtercola endophyticus]|uniref:MBL fold metallo-hydrolase n=1 Tax=Subtercola endophyticus TaxID=2895559 RepID=UPI001E5589AD|nr:MBL fold metallo-hydrolase [Subtercola endophyticus]UFS58702.1 MBL fold metallo-hydrolase [Subtercola endophyticus]
MKATSTALFEAEGAGTLAPFEQVRPNVWALPLAMPMKHLPVVLSYLVVDVSGGVHVIDPGWDSDENWQRVLDALEHLGSSPSRVVSVTITHLHRDHIGMAARYRAQTPARLQLSRIDQLALNVDPREALRAARVQVDSWGVPDDRRAELDVNFGAEAESAPVEAPLQSDVLLDEGDDLGIDLGDHPGDGLGTHPGDGLGTDSTGIRVVLTPGHTSGSVCLALPGEKVLFTGDHVLPTIFSGLGLGAQTPSNPVTDYLEALDTIAIYDDYEVLPGHGYRFTGLAERRAELAEHHLRRSREAAAVLADDPSASVWSVASRLHWTAGWNNLQGPMLRSALAQTAWHMERAR